LSCSVLGINVLTLSKKTLEFDLKHNKPCLQIQPGTKNVAQRVRDFVADNEMETLNVAG
jgi:hypothetical protein